MSKTYILKPWDEVTNHHFISKERWGALANCELEAKIFDGFLSSSALIYPKGETPTLGNTYIVDKSDLKEVVKKAPKTKTKTETPANNPTELKEKTYTKDEIRNAGMRAMKVAEDEESAIVSALAIARLINELN